MLHFSHIRSTLCLLTALCWSTFVSGQGKAQREYSRVFDTYYFRGPISYTGSFGLATYKGDLSSGVIGTLGPVFSVGANYKLWPHTIFGAEFSYLKLASKDASPERGIGFKSSNLELDLYARYLLIDDIQRKGKDKLRKPGKVKPYIMTGIGILRYKPKSYIYGTPTDPIGQLSEGVKYSRLGVVIPVGGGLSIFMTHRISLIVEANYRLTFSDYLDDVSLRGNPKQNDGYAAFNIKVQYTPTAPKAKKKRKTHAPPPAYEGPKGTDTWKNRKKKPIETPYEETQEPAPQETNPENTDPNDNGDGDGKIEDQIVEPDKENSPPEEIK
jgi:hypothetical protein